MSLEMALSPLFMVGRRQTKSLMSILPMLTDGTPKGRSTYEKPPGSACAANELNSRKEFRYDVNQ